MPSEQDALLQQYLREIEVLALDDDAQAPLWHAYKRLPTPRLRLRLYEANLRRLARMVLKEYPGDGRVLDMIQDAALEMAGAIDRFDPDREKSFGAYIADLVRIQCRRTHRKLATPVKFAHTHFEIPIPEADEFDAEAMSEAADTPEDEALRREAAMELRVEVEEALAGVGEPEREVFRLRAFERKSISEIAQQVGASRAQVQSMWQAAFALVGERLGTEAPCES